MAKIKICGLTREQDIYAVNEFLPDYAGFVFAKSRRKLTCPRAVELITILNPTIKPVGVFVNNDPGELTDIAKACNLAAVQLHGDEDNHYIDNLRKLLPEGTLVIKAVRVKSREILETASAIECDIFLLDSFQEGVAGGTGDTFDWTLLKDFTRPYFLAGGLNKNNVTIAVQMLHPFGIDVSSGVETDGLKDSNKILAFIKKARESITRSNIRT
ncbi:MAG: hypothetical protein APF84_07905 [Gracilibacter sp. BRH_c7a]|nr:MAG: hypothetical protein APF84_07905 [Gracilibacter sp. BRH_c7a]